ncbi:YIP1 family protein [Halothermothrix orenii]|uniref:Yip1 domain-containing protein n=1 Tax=Halothermothrix orenii (strain H 168 / OCM 544 / DSM 9562) TaxID=373903 RepID=B8D150_HALOH|nr:YIP1 family protein [Halothermothrix orenii]ACL69019.1 hypothetical protein Hore_02580 [Halothermothrix orenii H 168]
MSPWSKMVNIFLSPEEVFMDLKEKSDWVVPLVTILVISLLTTFILLPSVIIPKQVEQITNNPNLSLEQKNKSLEIIHGPVNYFITIIGSVLGMFIGVLILSGGLMLIRVIFKGEKVPFKNVFSGAVYTSLIPALGSIITTILSYYQNSLISSFNLSLFVPELNNKFIKMFIERITLFGVWEVILIGLMLSIFYKYSKKKAFSIAFGVYFILILFFIFLSQLLPPGA